MGRRIHLHLFLLLFLLLLLLLLPCSGLRNGCSGWPSKGSKKTPQQQKQQFPPHALLLPLQLPPLTTPALMQVLLMWMTNASLPRTQSTELTQQQQDPQQQKI